MTLETVFSTMLVFMSFTTKGESHQQYFRVKPKDTEIIEGQSADLQCHIGSQAGAVQWSKDGFVLGFDPDIPGYPRFSMIVDERRSVYNLRLRGVQLDDEGEYQCQVGPATKNHPIRAEARVSVLVPPRKLEILNHENGSTLEVREAERIALTCISKHSNPAAKLKWYRNGVLLQGGSFHPREETTGHKVHTTLSTITVYVIMDDNGASYTCEAIHRALSHPLRAKITIDVLYPPGIPEIEGYQEGDIVQVGDTLTLACITRGGNPPAELIWYRDNVQVDMSYSTSGREVTNIHTFTVDATDNNAVYRCEASNTVTYHPRMASVKLSVLFAPSKIAIVGPKEGKVGNVITLSCSAGPSNPPSEITWVMDGKSMDSVFDVVVSRGGWLTTSNITITLTRQDPDNKTFTCYADSEALNNSIKETLTFIVVYPPSPPSILGYEVGTPIKAGDFQRFTCVSIGGNPLATLRWFKRDREVRAMSSVSGSGVFSELVIRADASDNGATYRCEAANSATEKTLVATVKLTVYFPPSSVTIKSVPSKSRTGEMVSITCESGSSNPESSLHWWRNGEIYSNYESEVNEALYGGKSTHSRLDLTVSPVDDEVVFTCQATNHVIQRSVHDSVTLHVLYKPEFPVPNLQKYDVNEGETIAINLTARGNPRVITYVWRKLSSILEESSHIPKNDLSKSNLRVVTRGPILEIKDSRRDDTGQYECNATNSEGAEAIIIVVNVHYPSIVTTLTRSVVVRQGDDASFECAAIGNPMRDDVIKWRRSSFDMGRTNKSSAWGRSYLTVLNVTRGDAGFFECVAFNGVGKESVGRTQLIVKFKPEVYLPKRFRKVATERGEKIRLTCLAVGAPIVTFVWSFDGGVIKESVGSTFPKYSLRTSQVDNITWESVLLVNDVREEDFGDYTCNGRNEMGHDHIKVSLRKRGKPDPPDNLQIQNISSDRVLLSWTPGFDGGIPQHFRIRFKEKETSEYSLVNVQPVNTSAYVIEGLVPGTDYSFSIMAWNTLGESDFGNDEVSAQTIISRRLPSTAVDTLSKDDESLPMFLFVIISVAGTLLLLINAGLVACYMQRKKKRQNTQEYNVPENKSNPFASSMYSRDKYHDTINGEALRSPLNESEDTFHEEILMKEIIKQDSDQEKCSKPNLRNTSTNLYGGSQSPKWTNSSESNCPDILKNGHSYGKELSSETASSTFDSTLKEIRRDSLVEEAVVDASIFFPLVAKEEHQVAATTNLALGVSTVDLGSGKSKSLVIHPPLTDAMNCVVDGHFL